jgi:multiple sugar transport system substrate-binding protein
MHEEGEIMKKRLVWCVLVMLIASSPFFAQGSNEGSGKQDVTEKSDLLLWLPPFASGNTLDQSFWEDTLAPWAEKNNVNLSIEITPWSGYEEKYLTGFASGEGPDVGYMYMQMFDDYINMGALEDLDKYFTQEEKDNYIYYKQGFMKGGQYALPFIVGNARVLFYNKAILKQAGIEQLPETWDEFVQCCQQIKAKCPGVMPYGQSWADPTIGLLDDNFYPFLWQSGGKIYNDDGTKLALQDNDGALQALQFLHDLRFKYGIVDDSELGISKIEDYFLEGKAAFICVGTNKVSEFDKAGIDWGFIPSLKNKTKGIWVASDALIINSASKHKDLAASLIKYITSAPVMTKYHKEISPFIPITKDEEYNDNPRFKEMYQQDAQYFHTLPVAKGLSSISDNLCKNLQLMMMGEISPEQVIQMTTDYSKNTLN